MIGTCKLTKHQGKFVKSHIIPRALSDKNLDQVARIEFGQLGARPQLKHTSWFDNRLVTTEGEAKLSLHDTIGTRVLEKFGLCWRHFPISQDVKRTQIEAADFELLEVDGADVAGLRLFFLSFLWRTAASRRPEFREIRVDVASMRKLRKIVNGEAAPNPSDFPVTLTLLTTKGQPQNLTPLRQRMAIPQLCEGLPKDVKIHRFFLDGLIAHIGRKSMDQRLAEAWGRRAVGADGLILVGRPYEGSFQEENLNILQDELERDWSEAADRIYRAIEKPKCQRDTISVDGSTRMTKFALQNSDDPGGKTWPKLARNGLQRPGR